jgi:hypothetical protein
VGATERKQSDSALVISKDYQIFAQQAPPDRPVFELGAQADRMPVPAHHLATGRAWIDVRDQFIFFNTKSHSSSPERVSLTMERIIEP